MKNEMNVDNFGEKKSDFDEKELILVVEDSEYLNDYISKNLRKNNYEVIQCHS